MTRTIAGLMTPDDAWLCYVILLQVRRLGVALTAHPLMSLKASDCLSHQVRRLGVALMAHPLMTLKTSDCLSHQVRRLGVALTAHPHAMAPQVIS